MAIFVRVEDASGAAYGDGPVVDVTSCQVTQALDRAGAFSFELPAGSPRASLLQPRRYVKIIEATNLGERELLHGIIDKVVKRVSESGTVLEVYGQDLLAELATRTVHDLALETVTTPQPTRMVWSLGPTVYTSADFPFTIYYGYNGSTPFYFNVGATEAFEAVYFDLSSTVIHDEHKGARLSATYYNSETGRWEQLNIVEDGTSTDPDGTMTQSGWVEFDPPALWGTTQVPAGSGPALYYVRFFIDIERYYSEETTYNDIMVRIRQPRDKAHVLESATYDAIMDYAPTGWAVTGSEVSEDQFLYFSGETVLAALIRVAESTGDHFRLGNGRELVWMKKADTVEVSPVRAVSGADPEAARDNDAVCLITELEEEQDTFRQVTRVYPYGGGAGDERVTLEYTDKSAPAGYTLNTAENYIKHDASDAVLRVDGVQSWAEIVALSTSPTQLKYASNQLFDRAFEWLRQRVDLNYFYRLEVVKLDQPPRPGQAMHVIAYYRPGTTEILDIDTVRDGAPLRVIEVTESLDADGARRVSLNLATIDRWAQTDTNEIVQEIVQSRIARSRATGVGSLLTRLALRGGTSESTYTPIWGGGTNATRIQGWEVDAATPAEPEVFVWDDDSALWRPQDIGLVGYGTATYGWGDLAGRSLVVGEYEDALVLYDDYHRAIARFSHAGDEYFRLGLPEDPGIWWDQATHKVVHDGQTTAPNSITYDKMLLPSGPYDYLRDGTFIQSGGAWESAEVHSRGLELIGITNLDVADPSDILAHRAGILFRPISYVDPDYTELDQYMLAMGSIGPEFWFYNSASLRLCSLDGTAGLGADAWWVELAQDGCTWRPSLDASDSMVLRMYYPGVDAFALWSLSDGTNNKMAQVELAGEAITARVGDASDLPDVLELTAEGVRARNYVGFLSDYDAGVTPPVGGLTINRPSNDYLKWYDGSEYRRLVDTDTPADGNLAIYDSSTGRWLAGPLAFPDVLVTISGGEIDATGCNYLRVNTEGAAATDDLDTINGGVIGQVLILQAHSAVRDVVVKHATGNIRLNGSADFTLDHYNDKLMLIYSANNLWCEMGRGDNGV